MRVASLLFLATLLFVSTASAHTWVFAYTTGPCANAGIRVNPDQEHAVAVAEDIDFLGDDWCVGAYVGTDPPDLCPTVTVNDVSRNVCIP